MSGFYFAFLAVLLAGLGARDQWAVAGLSLRQRARPGVLLVAVVVSLATAAFAAWAATVVVPLLAPKARVFLVALALAFAAAESLLIVPGRKPEEPTQSLVALVLVLLAHQATDAARFLVFAIAVGTNAPVAAGIGGALGGAVVLAAGWLLPELFTDPRLRVARRVLGGVLLVLALFVGLRTFGRL